MDSILVPQIVGSALSVNPTILPLAIRLQEADAEPPPISISCATTPVSSALWGDTIPPISCNVTWLSDHDAVGSRVINGDDIVA